MTTRPLYSPSWHRVAELRPRLRAHAEIHRQQARGQTWYVLEDRVSGRFHRFSPKAYQLIGSMDGRRTVQELWDMACERSGDEAPTQGDVIALLAQLHAADVLQTERAPDSAEIALRRAEQQRQRARSRWLSLLSWRIPLLDPERLLQRMMPVVRPLVGRTGAALWLAVVLPAAAVLVLHGRELVHGSLDRLLSARNLVAFWLLFLALKSLHELGHALVTKAYGGEVHDMGIWIRVLTPVPYVDASAAWRFPEKSRRILVGAAGMGVELFVAALALPVWVGAEPGLVRTLAFDTVLIAGVSTVLFNANPLLRYDGYYMLSDWLEIPNLGQRANRYVGHLCERILFGSEPERPPTAPGEPAWLVGYALASCAYRVLVVVAIGVFLGRVDVRLAAVFATGAAVLWGGVPIAKGLAFLSTSPRLAPVRARSIAVSAALVVALVVLVGLVPLPWRSRAEGVIWVPEEALVRTRAQGFIDAVVARPGERVQRGQPLFTLRDDALPARVAEIEARRRELLARGQAYTVSNRVNAQIVRDELGYVERDLAEARAQLADLTVVAGTDGRFVVADPEDLPGRFLEQGELVGYVMDLDVVTVRGVVPQADIDLVRHETRGVRVRLAEQLADSVPGVIRRVTPAASGDLPATALGTAGGGALPVDPRDDRGVTAFERVFQIDVELEGRPRFVNVGGRAFLRFDHGRAPLARQWYWRLRQLFLARFDA